MWFWMLVAFAAGVFVGYKYPRQVEQSVESAKKMVGEVKDKITKKGTPSS